MDRDEALSSTRSLAHHFSLREKVFAFLSASFLFLSLHLPPKMALAGRVALVTGSTQGIGQGMVRALASAGAGEC